MKLLVALLFATVAIAAATLRGTVEDRTSTGLADVPVKVTLPDRSFRETRTDSKGWFRIEDLPTGLVELVVTASGFRTKSLSLQVHADENTDRKIVLEVGCIETCGCDFEHHPVKPNLIRHAGPVWISGELVEEAGLYIAGAEVRLERPGSDIAVAKVQSDEHGDFLFEDVLPGVYTFRAHLDGRTDFVIETVAVRPDENITILDSLPLKRCPQGIVCKPSTLVDSNSLPICL